MKLFNRTLKVKNYKNLYYWLLSLTEQDAEYLQKLYERLSENKGNNTAATELVAICIYLYGSEKHTNQFPGDEKLINKLLKNMFENMSLFFSHKNKYIECDIRKIRITKRFDRKWELTKKGIEEAERIEKLLNDSNPGYKEKPNYDNHI